MIGQGEWGGSQIMTLDCRRGGRMRKANLRYTQQSKMTKKNVTLFIKGCRIVEVHHLASDNSLMKMSESAKGLMNGIQSFQ